MNKGAHEAITSSVLLKRVYSISIILEASPSHKGEYKFAAWHIDETNR